MTQRNPQSTPPTSETCHPSPAQSEIPDQLPSIPTPVFESWHDTLTTLIPFALSYEPREIQVSPEARKLLRAYENEIRRTPQADALAQTYATQHPNTAWRLALLLHTAASAAEHAAAPVQTPPPKKSHNSGWGRPEIAPIAKPRALNPAPITAEAAAGAIDLTRWFAAQQARLLQHFRDQADHLLLTKVTRYLERNGGTCTLGLLTDRLNLPADEAHRLATLFPTILRLTDSIPNALGRKSQSLTLLDHPSIPQPVPLENSSALPAPSEPPPLESIPSAETATADPSPADPSPAERIRPISPMLPIPAVQPIRRKSDFSDRSTTPHPTHELLSNCA